MKMNYLIMNGVFVIHLLFELSVVIWAESCSTPLGMADGRIKDNQITGSSYLFEDQPGVDGYQPRFARLNSSDGSGGWCSNSVEGSQYLQVDLLENKKVTEVLTQGRKEGREYISMFRLAYRREDDLFWRSVENASIVKVFKGNSDTDTVQQNRLPHPIIAQHIQFIPMGDEFLIYCFRLELLGCEWPIENNILKAYSAPVGVQTKDHDYTDNTYDGRIRSGKMTGGLGVLADGNLGDSGSSQVGYTQKKITLVFEFRQKHEFKRLKVYTLITPGLSSEFDRLTVYSSDNGRSYGTSKKFQFPAALKGRSGLVPVSIKLRRLPARYLKIVMFNPEENLILLGEVQFVVNGVSSPKSREGAKDTPGGDRNLEPSSFDAVTTVSTTYSRTDGNVSRDPKLFADSPSNVKSPPKGKERSAGSMKTIIIYAAAGGAGLLVVILLVVLVVQLRKRRSSRPKPAFQLTVMPAEIDDVEEVYEPLLKTTEFQGVAGCSTYLVQDRIHMKSLPNELEIPSSAVDFGARVGGGKFGEVFAGTLVAPPSENLPSSVRVCVGSPVFIEILKKAPALEVTMRFHDEIRELVALNHANIARLIAINTIDEPQFCLTENVDGQRLDAVIKSMSKDNKTRRTDLFRDIAHQIASALKYMSVARVVHRDIAVRNVLYGGVARVKLTNTAAACAAYYDCYYYMNQGKCLFPLRWMAPESVVDLTFSLQTDTWAYGVFLWELFSCGEKPMSTKSHKEVRQDLQMIYSKDAIDGDFLSCPTGCPSDVYDVMRRCWRPHPRDRIFAEHLVQVLKK